ncbi:MAG: PKD domain-containing protein, partial [Bacteroidetes bacterium]|nr:PKD domain-containing protein [Bacteroidota bacterium]
MKAVFLIIIGFFILFGASSQPSLDWIIHYNFPGTVNNKLEDVVTDEEGNVYTAGYSSKLLTMKYSPSGNLLWVDTFGSGGGYIAKKIAIDDLANIYIGGYGPGAVMNDYIILKYDSSGNLLWSVVFDSGGDDILNDMVLDDSANVYLTGQSGVIVTFAAVTAKYDSAGNQLWADTLYTPVGATLGSGIAIDKDYNCYVAGLRANNGGIFKYNRTGTLLWDTSLVITFWTGFFGIDIDDFGNIFVTGKHNALTGDFMLTARYDSTGLLLWYQDVGSPHGTGLMIKSDNKGNVYSIGYTYGEDARIAKYDSSGNLLWTKSTTVNADVFRDIEIGKNGKIYVVAGELDDDHITTIKYNTNGNIIWQKQYGSVSGASARGGRAIAVDTNLNVFAGGIDADSLGRSHCLIKYCQLTPAADFAVANMHLRPGDTVVVTSNNSLNITSWIWNFGDGFKDSVNFYPSHSYQNEGVYTLTFTAINSCGTATKSIKILVDSNILLDCNWKIIHADPMQRFNSVYFINRDTGFVTTKAGMVLKTTNGGVSWVSKNVAGSAVQLFDITFSYGGTGYVVGEQGTIYKTTDWGDSWTQQNTGITQDLRTVHFSSLNVGIVGGGVLADSAVVYRTTNGTSWTRQNISDKYNPIYSFSFLDVSKGYAGWANYSAGVGGLLYTSDQGQNWSMVNIPLP